MRPSVIITTYNNPAFLARVLACPILAQVEVIVADDGSGAETAALIQQVQSQRVASGHAPLLHAWIPDEGFRAAAARNAAVRLATGDYLIFIDGDCLPMADFITQHIALAQAGYWVTGNRVMLREAYTKQVLEQNIDVTALSYSDFKQLKKHKHIKRLQPLWRWPTQGWCAAWRTLQPRKWKNAKTCNLGVWRSDFEQVNGFDERYVGWGREDSDLVVRLINAGVFRKDGRYATGVIHLWHAMNDRAPLPENNERLRRVVAEKLVLPQVGLY